MKFKRPSWKATRRSTAIIVAMMFIAAPAGASIVVQNYMEADVLVAPPCFLKTAGVDAGNSTLASFSAGATDTIGVDGVNLLEEKITVTGMVGDRVIYTDVVHYENNCDEPIDVTLRTTGATGDWTGIAAELWISNTATPATIDPNLDPAATDDWQDTHITVNAGNAADPLVVTSGTVTVPAGSEIHGAYVISTDNSVTTPAATPATLNWVAEAVID